MKRLIGPLLVVVVLSVLPILLWQADAQGSALASADPFVETFDDNTGLERFRTGVYHRDDVIIAQTEWPGDHDLSCGPPSTSRTIHRNASDESFYT